MAVTPWSRGAKLTLNLAPQVTSVATRDKPLVLLSGWMGSTPRHLRRIREYYAGKGFDTYVFSAGPVEVLQPLKARKLMETNMEAVIKEMGDEDRPLVFHGFSMSGFLWGNAMISMDEQPERFDRFKNNLKAQIFDSPPDFEGIAGGISRSMGFGDFRSSLVKGFMNVYLEVTKNGTGVLHRAASARFHGNDLSHAPSLWFYSYYDPVAKWETCQVVADKWRAAGIESEEVVFEDTAHVQHLLKEPEKYTTALDNFLGKHGLLK